jgi:hypothetical protein
VHRRCLTNAGWSIAAAAARSGRAALRNGVREAGIKVSATKEVLTNASEDGREIPT